MRLLYTNFHDGDGGGHTTYVMALARGLSTDHAVHVAAPPGSRLLRQAATIEGVQVHAQPFPNGLRRWRARRAALRQLRALLHGNAFDIVHVNGSADHRLVMAALSGMARRPHVVLTKHNSKPMAGIGHAWRAWRATDAVIAVCDYTLRALRDSPYRRCRLEVVHNGVDIEHFAPCPADQAARARRAFVADPDVLLLGSSAGTADYKGWMDLVEAIATLPLPRQTRVHVLLAGKLPGAGDLARIDALGLASQVHFTGMLDDVRPVIAASDVGFVLSWDVETISFACREMMAMGRPMLVSDHAGLPENIVPGVDGWVVPKRDHAAIAAAVTALLAARDTLPAMQPAARAHAEAEFGLPRFIAATEALYVALRSTA